MICHGVAALLQGQKLCSTGYICPKSRGRLSFSVADSDPYKSGRSMADVWSHSLNVFLVQLPQRHMQDHDMHKQ